MSYKRYAYLIGANGPANVRLNYAETDVSRLAEALKGSYCQFTAVESVIAHSREEGLAKFRSFAEQCGPEDLLVVHFSGHAYFDDFDQQLYLFCNNTDSNNLITAIDIDAIKRILHRSRAQYKLLVLDCCHAKGAYEDGIKGEEEVQGFVKKIAQGSSTAILSACARKKRTRDPGDLGLTLALISFVEIEDTGIWERGKARQIAQLAGHATLLWMKELLDAAYSQRETRLERF